MSTSELNLNVGPRTIFVKRKNNQFPGLSKDVPVGWTTLQRREARLRWYAPYQGQSRRTIVRTFPNERNALIVVNTKQLSYGNFHKAAQSYMHKNNLFPIDIDKREHSSAALYIYSMNKLSTLLLPLNKCCNNVVVVSVIIIAFPNFVLTGGRGGLRKTFSRNNYTSRDTLS
jgi:hypothetical protein